MKKTLAILLSVLMLAIMAVPAMAVENNLCPKCKKNTYALSAHDDPQCEAEGKDIWACSSADCYYKEETVLPARGHAFPEKYEFVDGGCTKDSYDHRVCTRCGKDEKINVVTAPGHKLDDGVHLAANCTEPGRMLYTCTVCKIYTKTVPVNNEPYYYHDMVLVESPKTCKDEAVDKYECQNPGCDHVDYLPTTPVDHVDADANGVCDVCEAEITLDDEPHGFYAQIIKWISEIVEAFKAFIASIKGGSIF